MTPASWCRWCGEDLPKSRRELGDFCGSSCSHEYHADLGGYGWVLDLIAASNDRGRELDQTEGDGGRMAPRRGSV